MKADSMEDGRIRLQNCNVLQTHLFSPVKQEMFVLQLSFLPSFGNGVVLYRTSRWDGESVIGRYHCRLRGGWDASPLCKSQLARKDGDLTLVIPFSMDALSFLLNGTANLITESSLAA